jgi:hypothetical protein
MNFIEAIFHISPDGGSGTLEFLLFLCPLAGAVLISATRFMCTKAVPGRRR